MLSIVSLAVLASTALAKPIMLPTYNASEIFGGKGMRPSYNYTGLPPHEQGFQQGAYGPAAHPLEARQGASGWGSNGAGGCSVSRELATNPTNAASGDGDPHQNYWHVQLSEPISCGGGGCSVDETQTKSLTIGFSIGTNSNFKPGGNAVWFQPSFSVQEQWQTGNQYQCDGNPNGRVAIWQNVAHTAYSVANTPSGNCGESNSDYDTYVNIYRAPNQQNQGGGFYCVRDDGSGYVRNQGDGYWEGGCAGGPQPYCGNGQSP
ncbi:hypothetical protein BD324DRAFT_648775 [Kockovaella imperatae]|uniref:Uncharacterized protein n=1 Tax=Kockovaella imperatae TaxID=4999 RepID=A0A1Y1UQ72_9TREE|nr:hypothetical protein BD324DRAFT_648775 [Kockovaella imperatae]ORX40173.1 hypothetical protein BD324DRAFT_648775 [Kockovaella imperatae]